MKKLLLLAAFCLVGTVSASRVNRRLNDVKVEQTNIHEIISKLENRVLQLETIIRALLQAKDLEQLKKEMVEVQKYIDVLEKEPVA